MNYNISLIKSVWACSMSALSFDGRSCLANRDVGTDILTRVSMLPMSDIQMANSNRYSPKDNLLYDGHGPCNLFRFSESKRIICGSHEQERTFSHPKFRTSHFDSAWAILFQSSINSSSRGGLSPFPDIGDLSSNSNYVTNKRFPLSSFL